MHELSRLLTVLHETRALWSRLEKAESVKGAPLSAICSLHVPAFPCCFLLVEHPRAWEHTVKLWGYIYIYTHTHTHTYIYIYIYTYIYIYIEREREREIQIPCCLPDF